MLELLRSPISLTLWSDGLKLEGNVRERKLCLSNTHYRWGPGKVLKRLDWVGAVHDCWCVCMGVFTDDYIRRWRFL